MDPRFLGGRVVIIRYDQRGFGIENFSLDGIAVSVDNFKFCIFESILITILCVVQFNLISCNECFMINLPPWIQLLCRIECRTYITVHGLKVFLSTEILGYLGVSSKTWIWLIFLENCLAHHHSAYILGNPLLEQFVVEILLLFPWSWLMYCGYYIRRRSSFFHRPKNSTSICS